MKLDYADTDDPKLKQWECNFKLEDRIDEKKQLSS